jgi:hypothetical protein
MVRTLALLGLVAVAAATATAAPVAAQQPLRPLPKVGSCPIGYFASGDYCMPGGSRSTRGGIEKVGSSCPIGFFASGNYCLSGRDSTPRPSTRLAAPVRLAGSAPVTTASGAAEHRCLKSHCPAIPTPPSWAERDALAPEVAAKIAPMTMLWTAP